MKLVNKLGSLVLVFLVSPVASIAQQSRSDWANVENLKADTKIVVVTKTGREFAGTKRQSTDDTLFMETKFALQGNRTMSLAKGEIAELSKTKSRWVYQLIGLGIGIGVGVAVGSTADRRNSEDPGLGKALGGLLGGLGGLMTGTIFSRRPKIRQVYVAP